MAVGTLMNRSSEEDVLRHEGALAAEQGRHWFANPYLRRENMPCATGESPQRWAFKHDAWQRGFDGSGDLDSGKETLGATMLAEMMERRLRGMPKVRAELARGAFLRVALPVAQARDAQGRNWDLEGFECGELHVEACVVEFRLAVDLLRDTYDMA
jgi:hypothetical protein